MWMIAINSGVSVVVIYRGELFWAIAQGPYQILAIQLADRQSLVGHLYVHTPTEPSVVH